MDDDISLLNAIVKNTEMGTSSLDQIIDAAENEAFKSSLQIQKQKYSYFRHTMMVLDWYFVKLLLVDYRLYVLQILEDLP